MSTLAQTRTSRSTAVSGGLLRWVQLHPDAEQRHLHRPTRPIPPDVGVPGGVDEPAERPARDGPNDVESSDTRATGSQDQQPERLDGPRFVRVGHERQDLATTGAPSRRGLAPVDGRERCSVRREERARLSALRRDRERAPVAERDAVRPGATVLEPEQDAELGARAVAGPLDRDGERLTGTVVERHLERIGLLVHDPSLDEDGRAGRLGARGFLHVIHHAETLASRPAVGG